MCPELLLTSIIVPIMDKNPGKLLDISVLHGCDFAIMVIMLSGSEHSFGFSAVFASLIVLRSSGLFHHVRPTGLCSQKDLSLRVMVKYQCTH